MPDPDGVRQQATDVVERLANAVAARLRDEFARPFASGLYLVATPIGNLGDMSPRALATLARADRIYCEDTRVSRPMLAGFGVVGRLSSYHEHNGERARAAILERLEAGGAIALISDAGMPAISDPGFKLARDVIAAGYDVFVIPGPSALTAAVAVSGLPTDSFHFAGFLPQKQAGRRARIGGLKDVPGSLVFYESPHRLAATLGDLAKVLGNRPAAVARELTKKFEEVRRGSLEELADWAGETPPRGEVAIVVGPSKAEPAKIDDAAIIAALGDALADMRPSAAARQVADRLGVSRQRVYDLSVAIKRDRT